MNRRSFTLSSAALAALQSARGLSAGLPFSALGLCSPLTNAEAVKAAGGEYIEEKAADFLIPDRPEADWLKNLETARAAALPVRACNSFLPGSLRSTGKDADHEAVLAYADTAFRRAGQLGIEVIVFGSSGSRKMKEGDSQPQAERQFTDLLKRMGPLAEGHGVTVAIEPLRRQECNFINTVLEGAAIAEKVSHPNIRRLFDIYHMLQNGEDPNDLRKAARLLVHGHIAEKEKRTAPGVMGDDFRPFFAVLKDIGFHGRLSIEGKWKIEHLPKAYETIRRQAREA